MLQKLVKPFVHLLPESNRLERIWILAKFDFKSRYYYHSLGILWALIKPLFEFAVFYILFTVILKNDIPYYALYLFLGLILWYFFVEGTNKGILVLRQKQYLIENIQFNRGDLFIAITFSAFLAFAFNFLAYALMSLVMGVVPFHAYLFFFPLLLGAFFTFTMGTSLILATLSIYLKDIQHLWDMVLLAGFWLTPILYDVALIGDNLPFLLYMNPVTGIIINIREVLLYGNPPDFALLCVSLAYALVIFGLGYFMFRRYSHKAAEKF